MKVCIQKNPNNLKSIILGVSGKLLDFPSDLLRISNVSEDILSICQQCLVATTMGLCVLDLRNRCPVEIVSFNQFLPNNTSLLSSLSSRAVISSSPSSIICLYQAAMNNNCRQVEERVFPERIDCKLH